MKKTTVNAAVNAAINELRVDKSGDSELLATSKEGWDDLNVLKNELASSMLTFVVEIDNINNSPELQSLLGSRKPEFDKLLDVFFSDIDRFSKTIETLRNQHEHRSGSITSMEELNEFTRLSMSYQTLQIEINTLLAPTMGAIVLLMHEVAPTHVAATQNEKQTDTEAANVA